MFHSRSNVWAARALMALSCAAFSCSQPPRAPLSDAELERTLRERPATPEELQVALDLAGLDRLSLPKRRAPPELDPDDGHVWHSFATVYEPGVREARRTLEAAMARAGTAGAPSPFQVQVNTKSYERPTHETELAWMFDILGLFGAGRAAARQELADAEVRAALAALEASVWKAQFRAERARIAVAIERSRAEALEPLLEEAAEDRRRVEILARAGRVSDAESSWARAVEHGLEHALSAARSDLAMARAELSEAAGVPPDSPLIAGVSRKTLERLESTAPGECVMPPTDSLLMRVPVLRSLRFQYGLAEARLRRAVAEQVPQIMFGPRATFEPGNLLMGSMLQIDSVSFGAAAGEIDAAVAERTKARGILEDALLATQARVRSCQVWVAEAVKRRDEHASPLEAAAARAWQSERTLFRNGMMSVAQWSLALERRIAPLNTYFDARKDSQMAVVQWRESCAEELDADLHPHGNAATDAASMAEDVR